MTDDVLTPPPDRPRSRRRFRLLALFFSAAFFALVLVSALLAGRYYFIKRLPVADGTFTHPALTAPVKVTRDTWGIPHIEAATAEDAYLAYGFTLAQDRLFQMEMHRRAALGELAELDPSEASIAMDKIARTLMWRKKSEEYLADESKIDSGFLRVLDSFLKGINYCIETQPLPVEFDLLEFTPRPFTRVDSLAFTGYMAFGFAEGIQGDALYASVQQRLPEFDVDALFPRYTRQNPVTIMEGIVPRSNSADALDTAANGAGEYGGLVALATELRALTSAFSVFHGSNSWVLGPSRTESGAAILANDPHIDFSNPHVWYEAHIRYGEYENYGVHLPLVPFPMIAHNRHKAWALTMLENDDTDLYEETFDPSDATRVMYKGEWTSVEQWTESIDVAGGNPIEMQITVTPHGPIITDLLQHYDGPPVSLWWGWLQAEDLAADTFYQVGLAKTPEEVAAALARWYAPGLNVSYADSQGNIAWWAAARLPLRPDHVSGKTVLDGGSGKDEMAGYLPFEENPHLLNPASGVIVTANNQPTIRPAGSIKQLEGYWQPSERADRIMQLLAQRDTWSIETLKSVQFDNYVESAKQIVPLILGSVGASKLELDRIEHQAMEALSVWNYDATTDSIGASVYHFAADAILHDAAGDEIGEDAYPAYRALAESWNAFKSFMGDPHSPVWDDRRTDAAETRADIIASGFRRGVADLREARGDNPGNWMWGKVHTIEYEHPLGAYDLKGLKPLRRVFNIGPFASPGATESVNNMLTGGDPYKVAAGPSMRLLIDYSDLTKSQNIIPTGNSGHFMSRHFADQRALFLEGGYRTINFTPEQIDANRESAMTLTPGS